MNTGVALNFGLPFDMYIKSIRSSSDHYKYLIWGRKKKPTFESPGLFGWPMVNWLRSGQFGLKWNWHWVAVHFDLFGETFLLFDLDIDLQSTTGVTILADWPHPLSTRAKPGGQHRIVNVLPDAVCVFRMSTSLPWCQKWEHVASNRLYNETNDWRLNKCIYFCDILPLYINLKPTPYCKFRGTIPKSIQKAVFNSPHRYRIKVLFVWYWWDESLNWSIALQLLMF